MRSNTIDSDVLEFGRRGTLTSQAAEDPPLERKSKTGSLGAEGDSKSSKLATAP